MPMSAELFQSKIGQFIQTWKNIYYSFKGVSFLPETEQEYAIQQFEGRTTMSNFWHERLDRMMPDPNDSSELLPEEAEFDQMLDDLRHEATSDLNHLAYVTVLSRGKGIAEWVREPDKVYQSWMEQVSSLWREKPDDFTWEGWIEYWLVPLRYSSGLLNSEGKLDARRDELRYAVDMARTRYSPEDFAAWKEKAFRDAKRWSDETSIFEIRSEVDSWFQ